MSRAPFCFTLFLQNTERSKDWYKTMFKQIHKLNRGTDFHLYKLCCAHMLTVVVRTETHVPRMLEAHALQLDLIRPWPA